MKERTPYLFLNQLAILFTQASTRSQWLGSSKTGVIHFVKKKKNGDVGCKWPPPNSNRRNTKGEMDNGKAGTKKSYLFDGKR